MGYDANSIETLSFRDAVRSRAAMYMGSEDNQGVLQCIREIITNSIDEATMGYGNAIFVDLYEGNRVVCADNGRGVPFGLRNDGIEALEAVYTMAHSGGKFNDKTYQNVAGLNGIGAKGCALSSDLFEVWSTRGNKVAYLRLEKGIKTSFTVVEASKDAHSGTTVSFIPSQEVYHLEPIRINFEDIKKMCRDWSYLYPQITFFLKDHITGEQITYHSENGLLNFLKDNGSKAIHKTPLHVILKEGDIEVEVVMEWTGERTERSYTFTNGLENVNGGTSLTGVKTALTNFFKKKMRGEGSPEILRKGLLYAISCRIPHPSFSDQTKSKVNNPELRGLCQRATTQMLENFELKHKEEFEKILELLTKEQKAELAAEKARQQILNAGKEVEKNQRRKVFASDKLKDAEFLGQDSTLLLVEGLSAASSIAVARDSSKYAILALRGKPINSFANPEEKFYQNEEIKLLLSAMNIVPGKYDSKKLRYGRIGILSDGDADGYAIGLLVMCALYKIAPEFIQEGRLYWMRTPLYSVKSGNKEYFYYTDNEYQAAKSKVRGITTRFKGLGGLNAEQARLSMFTPEYQRFEQLIPDEDSLPLLLSLMGEDSAPKRDFIFSNIDFSEIKE